MFSYTAKNLLAHRRRLLGTAAAVVLGVAFFAGTLVLGDTLRTNFDRLFTQADANTDVIVRSVTALSSDAGNERRLTLDRSNLDNVRAVAGVAAAQPSIQGDAKLVGKDGKAVGENGPPNRASNWISNPSLNPYRLAEGHAPRRDDEIVVNRGAADDGHLELGDTTTLLTPKPLRVRIVGIATFGNADAFGSATYAGLTEHAAERYLAGGSGQISQVMVRGEAGVSPDQLANRVSHVLPRGAEAVTGSTVADEQFSAISNGFLGVVRTALTVFALIALAVAAFSIQNTFSILTAQRGREIGLLRAIGASRRQVTVSAVMEAAVVGVVGSAVGLIAGVGVAGLLKGVFDGFGFALPAGGLTVKASSVALAALAGVVATVLASLIPAIRSSRVAPIAALRDLAAESRQISRARLAVGGVATGAGAAALVAAGAGAVAIPLAGMAALATLVGLVLVGPALTRAAAVIGGPLLRVARGVTGKLAQENASRNPRRTAATAAALMIGVTVVSLFTVFGSSLKASASASVDRSLRADVVIDTPGYGGMSGNGGFDPALVRRAASTTGVRSATGIANSQMRIGGSTHNMTAVDPHAIGDAVELDVTHGSVRALATDEIAVSDEMADDHGWHVGTRLPVTYPDGASAQVRVGATFDRTDFVNSILVPQRTWRVHAHQQVVSGVYVNVARGTSVDGVRDQLKSALASYGKPRVQDRAQYRASAASGVSTVLGLIYVMLALAIVIALLGIANTLSLSIHERARELGLLRAVGQTRRQLRSMIRWESVLVSVLGTVVGLAAGTFAGWAMVNALADDMFREVAIPTTQLALFLVIGAAAGVLAGIRPARRASRLDVLSAIAQD